MRVKLNVLSLCHTDTENEDVSWIMLVWNRVHCLAFVNEVMNIVVYKGTAFLGGLNSS